MKKISILLLAFVLLGCGSQCPQESLDPVDYVNTLMGTDSKYELSNGNTYPAVALPWGMNFWTPQTGDIGNGWGYVYAADKIQGFKQTHQPSPWINDYGQFSIMPVVGELKIDQRERASWFSHKAETAKPYYYRTYLADYDTSCEITPTERSAAFRVTFPQSEKSHIVVDCFDRGSYVKIIPEENKVVGYSTRNSGGVPENFKNYFVMVFDKPFDVAQVWNNSKVVANVMELNADHVGAALSFKTKKGEQVGIKVSSSFISPEQAEINLKEVADKSFDDIKIAGRKRWNDVLGVFEVSKENIDNVRTFYSCLYRCVLFPRLFVEFDQNGNAKHYSPFNGEVVDGYMTTDMGYWDTFRALLPLVNLVYPDMADKIQEGLLNSYKESGFFPEWASPGHRDCMIGNNSASVVADYYIKGGEKVDPNELYAGLLSGANSSHPTIKATGRLGWKEYNELGYVPADKYNESGARTLEYAYNDWCIWQMGKKLGRPAEELEIYKQRAQNYKNIYHSGYKLMHGKDENGKWEENFDPLRWGGTFTEGNSWQYTWSVFHDLQGLFELMGGEKEASMMLDSLFSMPPVFAEDSYGGLVIHEIREMQIMNFGNYAHGNQPIQHGPYIYSYLRQPWKTQYWVREIMKRLYSATPDGYCGDEDNGQTSAWYVMSSLGFYSVNPVSGQYIIGSPLFKKAQIKLQNGNTISIKADNNSSDNYYVRSMKLNGKSYNKNYVTYEEMVNGATISYVMGAEPNQNRGIADDDKPYSMSTTIE